MTDFETLIIERQPHVAVVLLNRPEKHNAISRRMSAELVDCIDALGADDEVRAIVLTGAGEKAFCAGADMGEAALGRGSDGDPESGAGGARDFAAVAAVRLARVRKPLIAAVNGYAYGGGAAFAIACDIRVCSDNARFRFLGASYGLVVGGSQLPPIVGAPVAKELLFTARVVEAKEAYRLGLANHVVPQSELMPAVLAMAAQIAEHSPAAVRASKEVVNIAASTKDAARRELQYNLELRQSEEHKERFVAAAKRVVRPE